MTKTVSMLACYTRITCNVIKTALMLQACFRIVCLFKH